MAQNYNEQNNLIESIYSYFYNLGYPNQNFEYEFATPFGRIDLLIRDADYDPFVIVETKKFSKKEVSILDSSVRQAHQYSKSVKAPYFVITNGSDFFWFETGSSGRPKEIDPIKYKFNEELKTIEREAEFTLSFLRNLRNKAAHSHSSLNYPNINEAVHFILLKLIAERENQGQIDNNLISSFLKNIPHPDNVRSDDLWKAADFLRDVKFSKLPDYQLLETIEQAFLIDAHYLGHSDLPKWLSTFMVQLSDLQNGDSILNLNVGLGRILAALSIEAQSFENINVYGQEKDLSFGPWTILPSYIFANALPRMIWKNIHFLDKKYSKVLCSPPFGRKGSSQEIDLVSDSLIFSDIKVRNHETEYLISAIESTKKGGIIVFLVPQGFLFRGGSDKQIRQAILEHTILKAIISMPSNTHIGYIPIKTSLLVIEKTLPKNTNHVFIGNIDEIPKTDEFDIPSNSQVQSVLSAYQDENFEQDKKPLFTYVAYEDIKNNEYDFNPTRYLQKFISIPEVFDLVPLTELTTSVTRGKPIRITEPGDSMVLTSAAIRTLTINSEEIKQIDTTQIPHNAIYTEEGDIVVNAVGTYLGNAAIVDKEFAGLPINQNILLIKPDKNQIDPVYLALAFNSDFLQTKFQTDGVIPSLNITQVKSALIPVPPIHIQNKLVAKYEQIQTELNESIEKQKNCEIDLKILFQHLNLEGRNEHPPSVIFPRIKESLQCTTK